MPARERAAPGVAPSITAPDADALPWARVITGLVALAIFAMPAGRHVAESAVRAIPDRTITVAALPPLDAPILLSRQPDGAPLEFALPLARSARSTARMRSAFGSAQPKELRTKAPQRRWPRLATTRHAAAASTRIARAGRGLTRAQVVREYMASREQVAALTREDSGSAYLMRVAARHPKAARPPFPALQRQGSRYAYWSRMTRVQPHTAASPAAVGDTTDRRSSVTDLRICRVRAGAGAKGSEPRAGPLSWAMREDHEGCGRPEELALSLPGAAQPGDPQKVLVAGAADAAVVGELSRLARELGLGAHAHSTDALKSELQKIVLALHPDKSGGEFRSETDKATFMKARRAIALLNSGGTADAPSAARQFAGAPPAITDNSGPTTAPEHEHRLQMSLLADACGRIARYFAAPKIASCAIAAVLLLLVVTADRFEAHPLLGPLLGEPAVVMLLAGLGLAAVTAAAALWVCERAALTHAGHLLSESALRELFEQARRSARRQGRIGHLSTFDIRRGIDVLADGCASSRAPRARRLLRRSLDATTRDAITLIQTKRLLARRVIRVVDRPSLEVLYEVSPSAMRETFR